jgi:hypothetical protein
MDQNQFHPAVFILDHISNLIDAYSVVWEIKYADGYDLPIVCSLCALLYMVVNSNCLNTLTCDFPFYTSTLGRPRHRSEDNIKMDLWGSRVWGCGLDSFGSG